MGAKLLDGTSEMVSDDTTTETPVSESVKETKPTKEAEAEIAETEEMSEEDTEEAAREKELTDRATRLAQSMKDKELKEVYAKQHALELELKQYRDSQESSKRKADREKTNAELKKELKEADIPDTVISDFIRQRDDMEDREAKFKKDYEEAKSEMETFAKNMKDSMAWKYAIQYGIEGGEGAMKELQDYHDKIMEAETDEGMELRAIRHRPNDEKKAKTPRTFKPDSSRTTGGPGGGKQRLGDYDKAKKEARNPQELLEMLKGKRVV